jgi:hypothetical protein
MQKFDPASVAFTLITFYPKWHKGKLRSITDTDKIRGDLALEFIQKASSVGYQVVVVDGKSAKTFRQELKKFPNIKATGRGGFKRSPAKRKAFKIASRLPGVKAIIATEAEKVSLIDFAEKLAQPVLDNRADIVIPKREDELFASTYPDYMYESETEGNRLYLEQLKAHGLLKNGQSYDLFFGPRVLANKPIVLNLFLRKSFSKLESKSEDKQYFDPEEYANAQFFPIVYALKKKLRIESVEIPFVYPKLQKENETKGARSYFEEKRKAQKMGILLELMHLLNYLK